ncbi:MAG: lipid-A-disaccharide synthase [Candidatus Delongbacteria bacterium]
MSPASSTTPCLMIVAGEASGDQIAARAVTCLRTLSPRTRVLAVGGPALTAAGAELVAPMESLAVMGLKDVLLRLPVIWWTWRKLRRAIRRERPQLLVLVDAPGFNLRLARAVRAEVPRLVYYISPKYWAWKAGRLESVARQTDRQALIFPFEEADYRRVGGHPLFVGHPVLDLVDHAPEREAARAALGLTPGETVLGLFAGSRPGELRRHLPLLRDCASVLADQPLRLVLQIPERIQARELVRSAGFPGNVRVVEGRFHEMLRAADLGLVASGTASLEAAVLGLPHLVYYKLDELAAWLAERIVKAPYASPVNLAAGRELVPELLNRRASGVLMADWVVRSLRQGGLAAAGDELARVTRENLGGPGASQRVAELLLEELRTAGVQP